MNAHHEADELRIAERAAEWHGVLSRTGADKAGEREHAEFMAWLEESPRHVREFLLVQAWEVQTAGIDAGREIDLEPVMRRARGKVVGLRGRIEDSGSPLTLPSPPYRGRGDGRKRWWAAAAAVVVAATAWWVLNAGQVYSTEVGELRTVELEDGSRIELNARSRVRIEYSGREREVRLLEGEALFDVARDPARPFEVQAGENRIQAVGTRFTINRRPLTTVVSVLDGAVRVATAEAQELLSAGEAVRIGLNGEIGVREPVAGADLAAWRERRLVFRDDALADIAAEINRYNRAPQIVVTGKAMTRRYGGIFDAGDPQSIVRFVTRDEELKVTRQNGQQYWIR